MEEVSEKELFETVPVRRAVSVTRAKNAMQEDTNIIRIGTSPMTPALL